MTKIKNSVSYNRYRTYLDAVKIAKTDEDLLVAGFALVEAWHGHHYEKIAQFSLVSVIPFIINEEQSKTL